MTGRHNQTNLDAELHDQQAYNHIGVHRNTLTYGEERTGKEMYSTRRRRLPQLHEETPRNVD